MVFQSIIFLFYSKVSFPFQFLFQLEKRFLVSLRALSANFTFRKQLKLRVTPDQDFYFLSDLLESLFKTNSFGDKVPNNDQEKGEKLRDQIAANISGFFSFS